MVGNTKKRKAFDTGWYLLAVGFSVWIWWSGSARAQESSSLVRKLYKEGPEAWEQQQNFYLSLDGTTRISRRVKAGGKWNSTSLKTHWKQYDGNMLDQVENLNSGSWKGFINSENSEYSFGLVRDDDTKPWVIKEVKKKTEKSADRWSARKTLLSDLLLAPRTPILPEVFKAKGFKCVSVVPEPKGDGETVRLTFTFLPEGVNRLRGGWLVLDPAHFWVIRSGEVELDLGDQLKGTSKWSINREYKEGSNHHPIITRDELRGKTWQNGSLISEEEYVAEDDHRERSSIPESEFTLSAFGFPEPSWIQPKRTRWYLWAGLCGILCVCTGALFRQFKGRAPKAAQSV